jgi:CRISPR-associated protein (TIGR03986 family)
MSFGRMKGRVNKTEFQFRDLQNQEYRNAMGTVYCGFLNECTGKITNYGIPHQIKYKEINSVYPNIENKSALEKYKKWGLVRSKFELSNKDAKMRLKSNGQYGYLFFSGKMRNKKSDFVLLDKDSSRDSLTVDKNVIGNFKKCYKKVPNTDLGIPVFFTMNNRNKVKTIGLCYNHRYIAQNDTEMAIPEGLRRNEPDLADVIFGYVDPNTKKAVKGRVQFQPAFISKLVVAINSPILTVLGSPRPSFYPTYLQNFATWDTTPAIIAGYKRYPIKEPLTIEKMSLRIDERNALKKQFPSEKQTQDFYEFAYEDQGVRLIPRNNGSIGNFDTLSLLKPLGKGTEFKGRITFFNLKKVELGALLSAMTFLNNEDIDKCYHSIGSAKAMGFGAVEISNISVKVRKNPKDGNELSVDENILSDAVGEFKSKMRNEVDPNYEKCSRIQDLIAMAKDNSNISDSLVPPQLSKFAPWKKDWNKQQATFPRFSILVQQKENK